MIHSWAAIGSDKSRWKLDSILSQKHNIIKLMRYSKSNANREVPSNKCLQKGQIPYDITYMKNLRQSNSETKNIIVVARGWGEVKMGKY